LEFERLNLLRVGQCHESDSHGVFVHSVLVEVKGNNFLFLRWHDVLGIACMIVNRPRVLDWGNVAALSDARVRTHIEKFRQKLGIIKETPSGFERLKFDLITID